MYYVTIEETKVITVGISGAKDEYEATEIASKLYNEEKFSFSGLSKNKECIFSVEDHCENPDINFVVMRENK